MMPNTLNGKAWMQRKRFPSTRLWLIEYSLAIFWIEYWLVVELLEGGGTAIFIISSRETLPLPAAVVEAERTERPLKSGRNQRSIVAGDTALWGFTYEMNRGFSLEQGTVGRTEGVFLR